MIHPFRIRSSAADAVAAPAPDGRNVDARAKLRLARSTAETWDRHSDWPVHRIRCFLQSQRDQAFGH